MLMLSIIYNSSSGEDGNLPQTQQNNNAHDCGSSSTVVPAGRRPARIWTCACRSTREGDGDHMAKGR